MRLPEPVTVVCRDGGSWRAARVTLAALSAGLVAAWAVLQTGGSSVRAMGLAVAAAAVAAAAAWRATAPRAALLHWTGENWAIDGESGEVDLMMDLGGWLLLRCRTGTACRWLPVPQADAALRAVLYASVQPRRSSR